MIKLYFVNSTSGWSCSKLLLILNCKDIYSKLEKFCNKAKQFVALSYLLELAISPALSSIESDYETSQEAV